MKRKISTYKYLNNILSILNKISTRSRTQNSWATTGYRCNENLMKISREMVLHPADKPLNSWNLKYNWQQYSQREIFSINSRHKQIRSTRNRSNWLMLLNLKTVSFSRSLCKKKPVNRLSPHLIKQLSLLQKPIVCHQSHNFPTRLTR